MSTAAWFYADRWHKEGPISREELLRRLGRHRAKEPVLVWREGLEAWAPPDDVPEFSEARVAPWFAVGTTKLVVMSLVTFGLYEVYWFYRQWKSVRARTTDTVHPVLGALFSGLSSFWLFARARDAADEAGVAVGWSGGAMATAYLLLSLLWRLPDPYWLACFLSIVPLAFVQSAIHAVNERRAPLAERNEGLSAANWAGVLVGGLVLLLCVVGVFLPEP
jgi:hypothetical protein